VAQGVAWSRDHYLIALDLYCKLPFGRFHQRNPVIIDVASRMGRTPGSLAMKLSNFAALDPVHKARGIKGLRGASAQDRVMWEEFQANMTTLGPEGERLLHDLFGANDAQELDVRRRRHGIRLIPSGPTERTTSVKTRRGQSFFRDAVIGAYGQRCCISGIDVPDLLIAGHIKPWSDFPDRRLDPRNGLCLSRLHDAAFEEGLITLDESLRLVLGRILKSRLSLGVIRAAFGRFEGRRIELPEKLAEPDPECLAYHRTVRFQG
jgi:putative restriction endonuclease